MKNRRFALAVLSITLAGTAGAFVLKLTSVNVATAQSIIAPAVAVSNDVNQHIHSISLRAEDVAALISVLNDSDAVPIESSVGYDQGIANHGTPHTHTVLLTKADLQTLQSTGNLTVQSESSLNHTHNFRFIMEAQCPAIMVPVPAPTASPSVVPSPSPSVSPSPSPSVSPSPSPSISPSPSVTPSPTPTETVSPTPRPRPSITFIPLPTVTPLPTFTVTPRPTLTPIGPIVTPRPIIRPSGVPSSTGGE